MILGEDIKNDVDITSLEVVEQDASLIQNVGQVIAVYAYLGAKPIAEALSQGVDCVVTGRVADPALVIGAPVAHFRWKWDDWNHLTAGILVGHLLECGGQAAGGYFADPGYRDVPHLEALDRSLGIIISVR